MQLVNIFGSDVITINFKHGVKEEGGQYLNINMKLF